MIIYGFLDAGLMNLDSATKPSRPVGDAKPMANHASDTQTHSTFGTIGVNQLTKMHHNHQYPQKRLNAN
jgi:hypothetical protein